MTDKIVAMDIETESLTPDKIWCICAEDVQTGEKEHFVHLTTIQEERERFIEYCSRYDKFIFHNGICFDVPIINRLVKKDLIPLESVIDTLIVSRLVDFDIKHGHGLKAWGIRLGNFKMDFSDFSMLSDEMIKYCHQDVTVTLRVYDKFKKEIHNPEWEWAMRCEHDIQILCQTMTDNGFYFKKDKAEELLDEIEQRKAHLEDAFQEDFPPKLEEVNRIKYRKKADGTLYSNVTNAQKKHAKTVVDWSNQEPELVCYDFIDFNPASPKMRIERLWDAGWKPFEKTKGHIDYERQSARAYR